MAGHEWKRQFDVRPTLPGTAAATWPLPAVPAEIEGGRPGEPEAPGEVPGNLLELHSEEPAPDARAAGLQAVAERRSGQAAHDEKGNEWELRCLTYATFSILERTIWQGIS